MSHDPLQKIKKELRIAANAMPAVIKSLRAAKRTFVSELGRARQLEYIRTSKLFNPEWYLRENRDVANAKMDPALHYLCHGGFEGRDPSPEFSSDEYLTLNADVRYARMNPLVHFEKFGRRENRPVSAFDTPDPQFPDGTMALERTFKRRPHKTGRTVVFASYFGNGHIPPTTLVYLRALAKLVDNIVFVADCLVFQDELNKLEGLVCYAKATRHKEYDFGSYKRGYEYLIKEGLLDCTEELFLVNDSCYAPVFPLEEAFSAMESSDCDFWGMTAYDYIRERHIQSFFLAFKRKEIIKDILWQFLSRVGACSERWQVIIRYEIKLTRFIEEHGYRFETYMPLNAISGAPVKRPLTCLKKFRLPLVKVKAIAGDSLEPIGEVMELIEKENPELAVAIRQTNAKRNPERDESLNGLNRGNAVAGHHSLLDRNIADYPRKIAKWRAVVQEGGCLKAIFFVTMPSMFAARALFEAMLKDPMFDPFLCVIPDLRLKDKAILEMMRSEDEIRSIYGEGRMIVVRPGELGIWPEVTGDAAIAVYSLPYSVSSSRYNPRYSIGRDFLAVGVNYGFYRSIYDRNVVALQNYAYFWKALFECEDSLREYSEYSILKGANADLVGYVKMDGLAKVVPPCRVRKRILVAPHHSVDGGANEILALSNFSRYADYFLEMADMHPGVDFVFRPHPFLFKVMSQDNQWGIARVERYIAAMKAKPNVIWSDGGDYFREFAESDACIQDCGSYLVEYFYTKKPCCYMLKSPDDIEAKFAPLGRKCLENCYIAYDTAAIDSFIRDVVIGGDDPKKASREAFADTIMVNYPHAADVALEHIRAGIMEYTDSNKDGGNK